MTIAPIDHTPLQSAVSALFATADEETRAAGLRWYSDAYFDACALGEDYGLSTDSAAGVIAALSPNLRWDGNIRAARAVLDGGTSEAYPANEYKARRIQFGESPSDVLGGLKVRAFYRNIASAGSDNGVTIDGHAFNAAFNLIQPVKAARISVRNHRALTLAYQGAAWDAGITPPAMQATVWIVWRDIALGGTRYADRQVSA